MKKGLTHPHEKLAAAPAGLSFRTSSKTLTVESTNPRLSPLSATDEARTKERPLMKADDGFTLCLRTNIPRCEKNTVLLDFQNFLLPRFFAHCC